jgi:hypothetical protein
MTTYRVAAFDPEQDRWRLVGPSFEEHPPAAKLSEEMPLASTVVQLDKRNWPMRLFHVKLDIVERILNDLTESGEIEG